MITKSPFQQPGSIVKITLLPQKALTSFFAYNLHKTKVISYVNFNPQIIADWINLYFTIDTASYELNPTNNNKGAFYQATIQCFTPANDVNLLNFLQQYKNSKFILRLQTFNEVYLIGDKSFGLELQVNFNHPKTVNNTTGYTLKFVGDFKIPPPIYDPQI